MDYRHKLMRGTVSAVTNKALHDIRNDPKRSIRNLADLGELFSTSATQRHFFSLARGILKNPANPYNELLVKMTKNVNLDSVRTLSVNFGYTVLSYGAELLRRHQLELNRRIPWLIIFDLKETGGKRISLQQISAYITDAIALGIYTFIFMADQPSDMDSIFRICDLFTECVFFVACSSDMMMEDNVETTRTKSNLIVSLDATSYFITDHIAQAFHRLRNDGCFFGFHAIYSDENIPRLTSDEFTHQMIKEGCLIGTYVNQNARLEELENRVYSFACKKRGKNGEPLFAMDFYRDISYVGKSISCGNYMMIRSDGTVPGYQKNLNGMSLPDLMKTGAALY